MQTWSKFCPENFLHKYLLINAEIARFRGKNKLAKSLYDQAINSARDNQYTQNEAIANERAALFMQETENVNDAREYMMQAHYGYIRWGATAKAKDLEEKYPDLILDKFTNKAGADSTTDTEITTVVSGAAGSQTLDIATVIKTSQTLSSEMDLGRLLASIMKLSIENAGAQTGYLILENEEDKKLYIEATGRADSDVDILKSIPLEKSDAISVSIVNYVNKTGENIVLADASTDRRFVNDKYITGNKIKSLLCAPIMHKGKTAGIIYLENNLTTNAFTPERVELLQIFSSQAAISIENSRLIKHRENEAKLRTEMNIAAEIQQVMLPKNPRIDGFDVTAYMKPADDVGGDYYDVINTPSKDWVVIGDVSGHGVPAGLIMMMVQTAIQTMAREYPDTKPSKLLSAVNAAIKYNVENMAEQKYMTINVFSFDKDGAAVHSGLHQDIMVYRAASGDIERVPTDGIWLSAWDLGHDGVDSILKLEKGDVMLLYTDGITEPKDANGDMFTEEKLADILKKSGRNKTDEIRDVILGALEGYILDDDVTMVILKKL